MIDSLIFEGNNGQTITLNDDTYPLTLFDSTVETNTDERLRPSQHGLYQTFTFMGKRIFHMEGDIFAADSADFLTKRQHLLGPFIPSPELGNRSVGYLKIKYTGLTEAVSAECYLDGFVQAPLEALSPSRGSFVISLQAFDPVLYGLNPINVQATVPSGGTGRTFPISFPVSWGSVGSTGNTNVTNNGNASVPPIVNIVGPCTDPTLVIHINGDDYTWALSGITLDANQTLTADFKNRTVVTDTLGSAYNFVVPGSQWWSIPPGSHQVSFRAFQAGAGCHATITYANAYML